MSTKEVSNKAYAFELWCWRRLLRVPWTARRFNQSILKEISLEYSLEALMLKLKLQYFGHLMWELTHLKRPWCWERLRAKGEGDNEGWDGWMASLIQWTWVLSELRELVINREAWRAVVHGVTESDMTERMNWEADSGTHITEAQEDTADIHRKGSVISSITQWDRAHLGS